MWIRVGVCVHVHECASVYVHEHSPAYYMYDVTILYSGDVKMSVYVRVHVHVHVCVRVYVYVRVHVCVGMVCMFVGSCVATKLFIGDLPAMGRG